MVLLTKGNTKIHKAVGCFSISTESCHQRCPGCYAVKIERRWPSVSKAWKRNLDISKSDNFIDTMIIEAMDYEIVRVHVAGDFYSDEYIDKWESIASQCPSTMFYTYTKNLKALRLNNLDNFNVINSITPIGLNYGNEVHIRKLESLGYIRCPLTKNHKGLYCMKDCKICLTADKVCFLKH